jgi:hypothetical protein
VSGAEFLPRLNSSALAAQPFSVEEMLAWTSDTNTGGERAARLAVPSAKRAADREAA